MCTTAVVSSCDELNCHEFSKIWPIPDYWSQKINICLAYKHASLSDCYYSNQHETLLLFRRYVCSTELQRLWTWQLKQQHVPLERAFGWSYQPEQSICLVFFQQIYFSLISLNRIYLYLDKKSWGRQKQFWFNLMHFNRKMKKKEMKSFAK